MSKYHNGPNGPGICKAKKGNCPFGGDDAHYNSLEEATKAYEETCEKEFGLLPSQGSNEAVYVQGYNAHNIPLSGASFVKSSGKGNDYDKKYFQSLIDKPGMTAQDMVDILNNDDKVYGAWSILEKGEDKTILSTEDPFGNMKTVKIEKVEKKEVVVGIQAKNNSGINMSIANYVSSGVGGKQERREYITDLMESNKSNPKKLVEKLNSSKRIFGQWELKEETDKFLELKSTDSWGNVNFIKIGK